MADNIGRQSRKGYLLALRTTYIGLACSVKFKFSSEFFMACLNETLFQMKQMLSFIALLSLPKLQN
ncbi:hypothetical protein QR98_0066060 [Sarcoptes scabiei]|uniref:Uncharacterized protein n=1 Tax=Sarcoptes scabiei TaxID=52283 RepID=A0A132AAT5_SARSC|nr:hypothetical protein QR98_0066060 [Sarcoptes scabiei]